MPEEQKKVGGRGQGEFVTTHWTIVLQAARTGRPETTRALEKLCAAYWYPLFVFIRRKGYNSHDAEDLTQMFFVHVISKESLKTVDQAKGRFRSFLLASLTNFLFNEQDRQYAQKRGGTHQIVGLDDCSPEELYRHEPIDRFTPQRLFERRWAFVLIDRVTDKLSAEYATAGKQKLFGQIHPFLTAEAGAVALAQPSALLGMDVSALKVAIHRMRRRFGMLLRHEISKTVSSAEEVEAEIRDLMKVIAE